MVRTLRRLVLLTACAAALSVPALARDHRGNDRSRVVVVVNGYDRDDGWRRGGWDRGRRVGWRGCDLPPGLAKKYGCYDRPVLLLPRYYRPRTGVNLVFSIR